MIQAIVLGIITVAIVAVIVAVVQTVAKRPRLPWDQ